MDVELHEDIVCEIVPDTSADATSQFDYDTILFDLDAKLDSLSSKGDAADYVVAIGSGLVSALVDVLWVGDFSITEGREIASDKVDSFVKKTAKMLGCKDADDVQSAVSFLEKKFPIPSDGNTPDFGGGLQHHLRDFAHHPTIVGLMFSLLTQFTKRSYGTDVTGKFISVKVPEKSLNFIGKNVPEKIFYGTVTWFFHLVSDVAGSSTTAGRTGGTGIPGPILSLAKELSALPLFRNIKPDGENSLSVFLSKLFNGTLFMRRDEAGQIIRDSVIKFDLRTELGIGIELTKQALPVVLNECLVRIFYFIRRLSTELKAKKVSSIRDLNMISWEDIKPANSPTLTRMLLIATGVFTAVDVGTAVVTKKYFVSINYVGVGRFCVAIGSEIGWGLRRRNLIRIREMYSKISEQTFQKKDAEAYEHLQHDLMRDGKAFQLTEEQTEILYNIEYFKTVCDIERTSTSALKELKREWLQEWKEYITLGFRDFMQSETAEMHWCQNFVELQKRIEENDPKGIWYRLVLLEAMLFEAYYPLAVEKNKKGEDIPSKKYKYLKLPRCGMHQDIGDSYLDSNFAKVYGLSGYPARLRKRYKAFENELSKLLQKVIVSISITAVITALTMWGMGVFSAKIAVLLVGSKFATLSGAALNSACLAYLGGGAIAAGGAGMAGGTFTIVGGGAALGLGAGAGVGSAATAAGFKGEESAIREGAKLLTSVREIFLNDDNDIAYSNLVCKMYAEQIDRVAHDLEEMKLKLKVLKGKQEIKRLEKQIDEAEKALDAMKRAHQTMMDFMGGINVGLLSAGNSVT